MPFGGAHLVDDADLLLADLDLLDQQSKYFDATLQVGVVTAGEKT
jgi:hypothetical protein